MAPAAQRPPPLHLLLVARDLPPDRFAGTGTVALELLGAARRAGHRVRVVCGVYGSRAELPSGSLAVRLRGPRPHRYRQLHRAACAAIAAERPDAVLGNCLEAPAVQVPSIAVLHDVNFGGARGAALRARLYAWRARRFRARVAVSQATAGRLDALGTPTDAVIHPPVSRDFRPLAHGPGASDTLDLLLPGRLHPGKGHDIVLDALGLLAPAERRRLRLTIAGGRAAPAWTRRLRARVHATPGVSLQIDPARLAPLYQRAHGVLFPTRLEEGFGYTAAEAACCGVPVLHSDQPAIGEAAGEAGQAVTATPRAWAEALRGWLDGGWAPAAHRARAAAERHRSRLCPDHLWARYEQLIRGLL